MSHFTDFNGWFVFHCHILAHEDSGMMQSIEVLLPGETPKPPPTSSARHPRPGHHGGLKVSVSPSAAPARRSPPPRG